MNVFSTARVEAAMALYERARFLPPGGEASSASERALLYVLDGSRPEDEYLATSAYRNARFAHRRSERRRREALQTVGSEVSAGLGNAVADAYAASAEDEYMEKALWRDLLEASRTLSVLGPVVLRDLVHGIPIAETVQSTGLSERSVKRIRQSLRAKALAWSTGAAA